MKKIFLIATIALSYCTTTSYAQDVSQSQIPSLIINNFQKTFPKAFDIEWEMDGENYKVEFEIGFLGKDHDVWFNKAGKIIRHKEEISDSDLPQKVKSKISSEFGSYRVDDVKKLTENNKTTYTLELKSFSEEWKIAFDASGNIISKIAD